MKIYYVTSGFRRPIDMLDNAVIKALLRKRMQVEIFHLNRTPLGHLLPDLHKFAPDLLFTLCGPKSYLPVDIVRSARRAGVPTAVWFTDDPYAIDNSLEVAAEYDFVFTIDSGCIPFYQARGCKNVVHLPLGTDTDIYRPRPVHPSYRSDVCLVGTGYENRLAFMENVLRRLNGVNVRLVGHLWEKMKLPGTCVPHIRKKWINPQEAANYYNGAKIVLNIHRSQDDRLIDKNKTGAPGFSINNRTFDIAACRSFQLIDYRADLEHFYRLEDEIVFFETPEQCAEQIGRFLSDAELRSRIAGRTYERTMANHTFEHRLETMMTHIRSSTYLFHQ